MCCVLCVCVCFCVETLLFDHILIVIHILSLPIILAVVRLGIEGAATVFGKLRRNNGE